MALAFTAPRGPLLKAAQLCNKIVERRNTIPILSNLALRSTAEGGLAITGTDLDLEATFALPGQTVAVSSPGATTVPSGLLVDILRKFPEGAEISFTDKGDGRATISVGRSRFQLHSLPVEDFPSIAAGTFTVEMDLSPKIFRRMSDEVAFAISTEETRYYLNGIYLHAPSLDSTAQLTAVATDGHRLSRSILCPYEAEAAMPGVIVPRKTVSQFGMIADAVDEDQTIRVSVSESKIAFEAGDLKLVSKLIDGTFPDYNRVIPANNPKLYCIDRAGLAGTVDRVQTISNERGRAAKFAFTADEVEVSVRSPDAGEAREALALEAEGPGTEDAMEIGFNAKYALDILSTLKGATVAFAMADPGSPSVISDPDDATRLVVLMPMRV